METKTVKQALNTLNILFIALLSGMLLFLTVVYMLVPNSNSAFDLEYSDSTFFYVSLVLCITGVLMSVYIPKKMLREAITKNTLAEKLQVYTVSYIIKLVFIEGACLFTTTIYLLEGDAVYLVLAGTMILYFITHKPSVNRVAIHLELSLDERNKLNMPNSVL